MLISPRMGEQALAAENRGFLEHSEASSEVPTRGAKKNSHRNMVIFCILLSKFLGLVLFLLFCFNMN